PPHTGKPYHDRPYYLPAGGRTVFRTMSGHEAIILAGGLGTRLRSAVPDLPKCMAPIHDKPFISYVIENLQQQGIKKFIISMGYKHEIITNYLESGNSPFTTNTTVQYSVENEPLGTGGAVMLAC